MELSVIGQRMTVTVRIWVMNGNGLVLGRRGCCSRGKIRVIMGGGGKIIGEYMRGSFDGCH
jgi:hypothetical protein